MRSLKRLGAIAVFAAAVPIVVLGAAAAGAAGPNTSFGFNARDITGLNATSGAVTLTGGGAFGSSSHPAHSGGSFSCTSTVTANGLLDGCQTGQGVRWDSDTLVSNQTFKCDASEPVANTVSTSADTVVLTADFYRAGDGTHESFTANMIVSAHDIDNTLTGVQNVWVQGVGCATGAVHFSP
jgi:poly(3-hydroxybutyrate) depolymerase